MNITVKNTLKRLGAQEPFRYGGGTFEERIFARSRMPEERSKPVCEWGESGDRPVRVGLVQAIENVDDNVRRPGVMAGRYQRDEVSTARVFKKLRGLIMVE